MNAEQLLTHFDRIADAPDAIPRLRRFILDLAVRGKLVEQDPNDEPASELLEEIEADRRKRSRSKRGRLPIAPTESQKEEVPYAIPEIWVWAPFGHITISLDGERIPVSKEERSSRPKLYDYYGASGVIDKIDNYLFDKPLLLIGEDGANLINRSTPIAFIARGKYWVNNHAHVLDGFSEDFLRYIELFVNAIDLKPYVTGTAQPKMNQAKMNSIPVALPPLAEQHRIVAKVDELMALCDRLDAAHTERKTTRHRLTTTSLARLNTPDPDPAVFRNDAAFTLDNVAPLATRPDQIKALRQTILSLAVRGKLVEQDPNDEPASELLKKITETRRSLIVESKMKRSKDLPPVEDKEIKFGIPAGWAVTRMGIAYDVRDGTHDSPKYVDDGYPLITSKNLSSGHLSFDDTKLIGKEDYIKISQRSAVVKGDILLAMIGSIGNPVIVDTDQPFAIKNVALLKYFDPNYSDPEFLRFFLLNAANEMKALAGGGLQPFVSLSFLRNYPLAIPPLAEQHRIVAEVDELMALCDRLEASLVAGDETRGRLLEALLHRAISVGVAPDDGSDNSGLDNNIQTRELEMS